jgi:hypothetical protein
MVAAKQVQNAYERAFEDWLAEHRVACLRVDQTHRYVQENGSAKTFDYVVYPREGGCVLVELKGRVFEGDSLAGRCGLERWVFDDDVRSLAFWQQRLSAVVEPAEAAFVFAYRLQLPWVDEDGLDVFEQDGQRYVFLAIRRQDYHKAIQRRSPRWKTVTCSADAFRAFSFPAERLWDEQLTIDY